MTNMPTGELIRVIDHAAGKDDRWLFLAALCVLLISGAIVIRWLVKQHQGVIADYKASSQAHGEALMRIISTQNETALKLAVCIDRNTEALNAFQRRSERVNV